MSISLRTFVVPTIAASVLMVSAGCSSQPAASSTGQAAAPTAGSTTAVAAVVLPAHDAAAAALPVTTPPKGTAVKAVLGSPTSHGKAAAATSQLEVKSYNAKTGTVVLGLAGSTAPGKTSGKSASPRPSTSASASASAPASATANKGANADRAAAVQPGQLIASPPTADAPHGFLATVTGVNTAPDGTVTVATKPADLTQLLGQSQAQGSTAVPAPSISVQPLIGNLQTTYTSSPGAASGSATDTLGLSVNASVPIPGTSASAAISGSVDINPSVAFSYSGAGFLKAPQQAHIGFSLGAQAQWKVSAALSAGTSLRIPLATLNANPVLMVAGFPIVINLGLQVYLVVGANGQISLTSEQTFNGDWSVGADYTAAGGWKSDTQPGTTTISPIKVTATGDASVTTGVEADANVGLYDTVGIEGTVEPYLRNQINGSITLDTSGNPPSASADWQLFGGLTVGGDLYAQLSILGTALIGGKLPLPAYNHEWPLETLGASTHASASPSASSSSAP